MNELMKQPKLSVVIPVYNVERYLKECLDSVLSQRLDSFEVLCIEDCSTDNSRAVLSQYAEKDDRIRCFYNGHNRGLSVARNIALSAATGEYVVFVDSDDFLAIDCLNQLYNCAKKDNLDVLYYDCVRIDDTGHHIDENIYTAGGHITSATTGIELLEHRLASGHWCCLVQCQIINLEFLHKHSIHFAEGFIHEDHAFSFKVAMLAERTMYIPLAAYCYRCRLSSIMTGSSITRHFEGYMRAYLDIAEIVEKYQVTHSVALRYLRFLHCHFEQFKCKYQDIMGTYAFWNTRDLYLLQRFLPMTKLWPLCSLDSVPILPENCKQVFLYGAGKVGRTIYLQLMDSGQLEKRRMGGFIVTGKTPDLEFYLGIPVFAIDEYRFSPGDCIVIAVGKKLQPEILKELEKRGINYLN